MRTALSINEENGNAPCNDDGNFALAISGRGALSPLYVGRLMGDPILSLFCLALFCPPIAAMLGGDSVVAIVLGCAALEGAHGAFMRLTLQDKIPGDVGEFNKFMNGLLQEQGFYSLVQLSVRVLMKTEERPTDDELKRCLNGVTTEMRSCMSPLKEPANTRFVSSRARKSGTDTAG